MATSPLNQKSNMHVRSNSLPSRSHPLIQKCNEHLNNLSASSSLNHKLGSLQDLIECVEQLVQLPLSQNSLRVDELSILDGSLRLLDACTAAKDALLHTKECTRELQSIIRRKRGCGLEVMTAEAKKFLNSRKVVRKAISKALTNLKGGATKKCNISSSDLINLLQEVEVATLSTFQTIMQFISGTTALSKSNSWILISKLIQTKRQTACAQVEDESEFAQVDEALHSFLFAKSGKFEQVNNLQNQLEEMETRIQDLEEGLEFLFRRLIKIRVSLLNILNH